jgi:fluoride exporter
MSTQSDFDASGRPSARLANHDTEPDPYTALSETHAISPVGSASESPIRIRRSLKDGFHSRPSYGDATVDDAIATTSKLGKQRTSDSHGRSIQRTAGHGPKGQGEYECPGFSDNLNEVVGPAPIQNPDESPIYRHQSLEERVSRRSHPSIAASPSRNAPELPSQHDVEKQGGWLSKRQFSPRLQTEIFTIAQLILFSILGTLVRLGLEALNTFPDAPVWFPILWANFAGTFFMGFLSEARALMQAAEPMPPPIQGPMLQAGNPFQQQDSRQPGAPPPPPLSPPSPLYIGLATGFCGSLTTFSSFARDLFLATVSDDPAGQEVMTLLAVSITTLCVCHGALRAGGHVAVAFAYLLPPRPSRTRYTRHPALGAAALVLATGLWAAAAGLAAGSGVAWRGVVLFALTFAPFGTLVRFYLSVRLNKLRPGFPVGTFTANILGTAVLGVMWVLQHGGFVDCTGAQVLQGVSDGFCGCLTTVSTWIVELSGLRRRHAYVYGSATVGTAFALLIVIMGSQKWTVGWKVVGAECPT